MVPSAFLDANVLLDLTLKREGFEKAAQIVRLAVKGRIALFTSSSIIHLLGYWLTKGYGQVKAKELIQSLMEEVRVLETTHDVIIQALESKIPDIEDAIQYHTSVYHQLDVFVSRDRSLQRTATSSLPICSPTEFLRNHENL
jgi:predicted nucleic acid-binding protein